MCLVIVKVMAVYVMGGTIYDDAICGSVLA